MQASELQMQALKIGHRLDRDLSSLAEGPHSCMESQSKARDAYRCEIFKLDV